jgi:hypothetical protein
VSWRVDARVVACAPARRRRRIVNAMTAPQLHGKLADLKSRVGSLEGKIKPPAEGSGSS